MSVVYTDITLENPVDVTKAVEGYIRDTEIRRLPVKALVDTGAWSLVINEDTRAKLGLRTVKDDEIEAAGGVTEKCKITEPVTVHWKDRRASFEAVVLPLGDDALMGAQVLEGLDLTVNPKRELVGAHGDKVFMMVK